MTPKSPLVTEHELAFFYALPLDEQEHYIDQVPLWTLSEDDDIQEKAAKIAVNDHK